MRETQDMVKLSIVFQKKNILQVFSEKLNFQKLSSPTLIDSQTGV